MKLPGRSTELLAPHDSAASVTGSGLMTALSGANYGAKGRMGMRRCSVVAGAKCVGLCRRVWDRRSGTATLELCRIGLSRIKGQGIAKSWGIRLEGRKVW